MEGKLTVFFEDPYWVGMFERWNEQGYSVARIVFGSEPMDAIVYEYVLANYASLPFTTPVDIPKESIEKPKNFKRMLRETKRATRETGVTSKVNESLRLEWEQTQKIQQETSKEKKEALEAEKYRLRQERKKEKKRGR